ncbi:MAG: protein kinase [Candidatus Sericytochromatia bacterium]|nr:protein kinase [Candidatus Sericytochromatia bacterium]
MSEIKAEESDPLELTMHEFGHLSPTAEMRENPTATPNAIGKQHYEILQMLGEGAMGTVHLVRDSRLERTVAYKQLHKRIQSDNPEVHQRFLGEVQITAQLPHPYIVPVYSLEVTEAGVGYTMKCIQGKTFKELITEAKAKNAEPHKITYPQDFPNLLEHFLKVCEALSFAHFKGVIHRDLKPANLMLGPHNEIYVMDWGIARPFGEAAKDYPFEAGEKNQMIGTPRYMSPEQARGVNDRLDERSDLFALGLILYELVCLQPGYKASSTSELLEKVRKGQLNPVAFFRPELKVPRELQAIISKATAWKRADRYPNVEAMSQDLRRYLRGEAVQAAPDTPLQAAGRWFRVHRTACLSSLMVLVLGSSLWTLWNLLQQQQTLQAALQREQVITQFMGQILNQGQAVDRYMVAIPRSLENMAGTAIQTLDHSKPQPNFPYYLDDDHWSKRVPDQIQSAHYGTKISTGWTTYTLPWGAPESSLKPYLHKLGPLKDYLRNLLIRSGKEQGATETDPKVLVAKQGVPLMYVNISTEEGILSFYPGASYNTPGYDVRKRPFYRLVRDKRGVHCGNPYIDRLSGSLLPCSLAIYDAQERFRGVVSIDLQFNYLARNVLNISNIPGLRNSYLLDEKGQVIVKGSDRNQKIEKREKINQGMQLSRFKNEDLLRKIELHSESGYLRNANTTLGYLRLNFQGWYFVVEAETEPLFAMSPSGKN